MFPTRSAMIRFGGKAGFEALVGGFRNTVETANKSIEARYPQIEKAEIQGTTPHRSAKDPSDPKNVITISYHTGKGTRLLSIHAHDDGTWNEFFSRAGKNVGGGESSRSSSAQGATTTDLTWRTNEQTNRAEWWDGTKWVEGDWSDEYQKWYACHNGQWYHRQHRAWNLRMLVEISMYHVMYYAHCLRGCMLPVPRSYRL